MKIKKIIRQIVDNGNVEDMYTLTDIFEDLVDTLESEGLNIYKEYEMKLYKMAYGTQLSREMAEEIVNKMRPYGQRWNIEEIEDVQRQYGLNHIKTTDMYVVMNSAYNDYKNIFDENIDYYIKFADDFINDEDAKEGKVFTYFTTLVE